MVYGRNAQYAAYNMATQTVARTKQVVLLYDGAIKAIHQAKRAIEEERIEDRFNHFKQAIEIVTGLRGCLDFEEGGDIAAILYDYYTSVNLRIFSTMNRNDTETCDQIVAELKKMRDAWEEVDRAEATGVQAQEEKSEEAPTVTSPASTADTDVAPMGGGGEDISAAMTAAAVYMSA